VTRRRAILPPASLTPPTLPSMSVVAPDTEPHQPDWYAPRQPSTMPAPPPSEAWEARTAFRRAAAISRSLTSESGRYAVTGGKATSDGLDKGKKR
jgi:type IV secretory pathway VirB10-like protein